MGGMDGDAVTGAPRTEVVTAEAALAGGVVLSLAHTLGRVSFENGYSWFGTQRATIIPYTLSMLLTVGLCARAATMTDGATRLLLRIMSATIFGLTFTPYSVSGLFNAVHMTLGSVLFVAQLLWTLWVALRTRERRYAVLFAIEFVGGALCFTSVVGYDTAMLWGQIIFQAAFFNALADQVGRAPIRRPSQRPSQVPALDRADRAWQESA